MKLKVSTSDTTLEALLTGVARLASFRDWPNVEVLNLQDPFQTETPCFQQSLSVNKDAGME